jgi:hypothetical protein
MALRQGDDPLLQNAVPIRPRLVSQSAGAHADHAQAATLTDLASSF